jgi:hypothetical protein
VDALFDSWDPDRSGAIEMGELCKRLRRADVMQKSAVSSPASPSPSGRAGSIDTGDASPAASRRRSSVSAALAQQQKNLERDRKMGSQRKMAVPAWATARREVDRQLLREVTKLYAVYLQRCTYICRIYAPPSRSPASPHSYHHPHCCAIAHPRWIYRNSPTNTGTFENVLRISHPGMSQGRRTEMMTRAQACYVVRQQANDRAEVERCVHVTTRIRLSHSL